MLNVLVFGACPGLQIKLGELLLSFRKIVMSILFPSPHVKLGLCEVRTIINN